MQEKTKTFSNHVINAYKLLHQTRQNTHGLVTMQGISLERQTLSQLQARTNPNMCLEVRIYSFKSEHPKFRPQTFL